MIGGVHTYWINRICVPQWLLNCHVTLLKKYFWELISWYNKFIRVDLVRVDLERIDLVGVDLVRVDLVRPNRGDARKYMV